MMLRENILAEVARWLDNYNELEELLGRRKHWVLEGAAEALRRSRRRSAELGKDAAALAREVLRLGDDWICNICGILEEHGAKVLTASIASEVFFGLSSRPRMAVPPCS